MDKKALENFAVKAREELINKVKIKADYYGITELIITEKTIISNDDNYVGDLRLNREENRAWDSLKSHIEDINTDDNYEKAYNTVIEEVAYTWFNRFIALRYMEIHDYLPSGVRVISSADGGADPEILKEALNVDLDVDKEKVYTLKQSAEASDRSELYKYMILKQCESLTDILPFLFDKTKDYVGLLFPDNLLGENEFLGMMLEIEEESWTQVEVIGWLYQYYISAENSRVIQAKKRYKKEEIPFATQLFTPDWIVRYMVQNSLGRYYVENHPEHKDLIKKWEFYIDDEDSNEVKAKTIKSLEEIKCLEPAMGSGHILIYMFELLYQIYEKNGYISNEIPMLIIENNLYGLEIDDRAYQLACFCVIMKGREYDNRFFKRIEKHIKETGAYINLNLSAIQETNIYKVEDAEYIAGEVSGENHLLVNQFIEQFKDAKIYGSLTEIKENNYNLMNELFLIAKNNSVKHIALSDSKIRVDKSFQDLIKQTRIMDGIYDILVTNPPYIGNKYLHPKLNSFISENYKDVKSDIFSAFIIYSMKKVKTNGQLGFMTPFVWMFIKSYENLRKTILDEKFISTLIQLEYSAFEEATVPLCTFTLKNQNIDKDGLYIKLSEFTGGMEVQKEKVLEALNDKKCEYFYKTNQNNFKKIPGSPIAYWASDNLLEMFSNYKIGDKFSVKKGMDTGNNNYFLKKWYEINNLKFIKFNMYNYKWIGYDKGGNYKKWFGNNEYVLNWENDGCELKNSNANLRSKHLYFKKHITWNALSSSNTCFRYSELEAFDSAGSSMFPDNNDLIYVLGLMNSIQTNYILNIVNPTLNYGAGSMATVPLINSETHKKEIIITVNKNIELSKLDWDQFETSWDFTKSPLLNTNSMASVYDKYKHDVENRFLTIQKNENELNRIFIDIYGLQDELTPEVADKDITVARIYDTKEDIPDSMKGNHYVLTKEDVIKQFISYAVGCMFGRYSLDEEGLIFAGGDFDESRYEKFKVDIDNVIPITDEKYFGDDIVERFFDFVKTVYGEETFDENIEFIADALGGKDDSKEIIRNYFIKDFFKDHCKMYKKRPIYWLFTSGKEKAFNALIYMHRYDKATLARIRTDYLHKQQNALSAKKRRLEEDLDYCNSTNEKKKVEKQITKVKKQLNEIELYDEKLHHMADMMIDIDLDDGVVVNHTKFEGLVEKIK